KPTRPPAPAVVHASVLREAEGTRRAGKKAAPNPSGPPARRRPEARRQCVSKGPALAHQPGPRGEAVGQRAEGEPQQQDEGEGAPRTSSVQADLTGEASTASGPAIGLLILLAARRAEPRPYAWFRKYVSSYN